MDIILVLYLFKGRGFFYFGGVVMLEIKNVSKTYFLGNNEIEALKDVSINIDRGEIFGIIGYSGAGKSTLLRALANLEDIDSGEIIINGTDILQLKGKSKRMFRQEIGVVFQGLNLFYQKNVFKNVAFPLEIAKVDSSEIEKRVLELLELTGIIDKEKAYISQLSGGQRQRVAIARALATRPKVLLLDEFTSALDRQTTKQILDLLVKINKEENVTICLITHDNEVVKQIATRVAVLHNGELIDIGPTSKVLNNSENKITKLLLGEE